MIWLDIVNWLSKITPRLRTVDCGCRVVDSSWTSVMFNLSSCCRDPSHISCVFCGFSRSRLARIQASTSQRLWTVWSCLQPVELARWCTIDHHIGAHCTSTVSALNYCSRIFSNPSAIYTKWCAQTFPPIFRLFAIFDRNFAKIVAPPSNECENYVACLKEQSLRKKRCKPRRNRPINGNAMRVRTMRPSNARRSGLGAWQTEKKHSDKEEEEYLFRR